MVNKFETGSEMITIRCVTVSKLWAEVLPELLAGTSAT